MSVLERLLDESPTPTPTESAERWWGGLLAATKGLAPIDVALVGGFVADRLGWAFASGYQAALRALFGVGERRAALCATEDGGGHPRAIHTRLEAGRLNGTKRFVTLGCFAERLFVVAREGEDPDGRPRLRVGAVDPMAPGVRFEVQPPIPFTPELPHTVVQLLGAPADILPGDGYARYLKPFRTVEDLHVHAALGGHLLQVGRRCGWPPDVLAALCAQVAALRGLAAEDPSAPQTHVALGGVLTNGGRVLRACADLWAQVEPEVRSRWERDQPLLGVAGKVRARRLEAAWRALGISPARR